MESQNITYPTGNSSFKPLEFGDSITPTEFRLSISEALTKITAAMEKVAAQIADEGLKLEVEHKRAAALPLEKRLVDSGSFITPALLESLVNDLDGVSMQVTNERVKRIGKTLAVAEAQKALNEAKLALQLQEASLQMNVPAECYGPRGGVDKEKFAAYLAENSKMQLQKEFEAQYSLHYAKAQEAEANQQYEESCRVLAALQTKAELINGILRLVV